MLTRVRWTGSGATSARIGAHTRWRQARQMVIHLHDAVAVDLRGIKVGHQVLLLN